MPSFDSCSKRPASAWAFFSWGPAPREIGLSHPQLGVIFGDRGFRLAQRFTERTRIYLEKQVASRDVCTLCEFDVKQGAAYLCFDLDAGVRLDIADSSNFYWH